MCSKVVCPKCKKISWAGCGRHVDIIMKNVKPEDRCKCK